MPEKVPVQLTSLYTRAYPVKAIRPTQGWCIFENNANANNYKSFHKLLEATQPAPTQILKEEEKETHDSRKARWETKEAPNLFWVICILKNIYKKIKTTETVPVLPWRVTSVRWGVIWLQSAWRFLPATADTTDRCHGRLPYFFLYQHLLLYNRECKTSAWLE